jgi:[ribosomal protein S18]-alanine N-acetyltransferase
MVNMYCDRSTCETVHTRPVDPYFDRKFVTIVAALPENIPELIDIQTECGLSPWTSEGYHLEMRRPDSIILAALNTSGDITGFIVGRAPKRIEDQSYAAEAEIYNLGTRTAFRQQGVASSLLGHFIKDCNKRGVRSIWLDVRAGNHTAISFYRSHGFVPVSTRRDFYSSPSEDATIMTLQLEDHDLTTA